MHNVATVDVLGEVCLKRSASKSEASARPEFPPRFVRVIPPEFIAKAWVRARGAGLGHLEYRVFSELVAHFNNRTHRGYPSKERLATLCNASPRTVQRALQKLLDFTPPDAAQPEPPIYQGPPASGRRTPTYGFTAWAYSCLPSTAFRRDELPPGVDGSSTGGGEAEGGPPPWGDNAPQAAETPVAPAETPAVVRGDNAGDAYKDRTLCLDSLARTLLDGRTLSAQSAEHIERALTRCLEYRYLHTEITPCAFERQADRKLVLERLADGLTEAELKAAVRGVLVDPYALQRRKEKTAFWVWGASDRTLELARKAPPPPAWEDAGKTKQAWEAEQAQLAAEQAAHQAEIYAQFEASLERRREAALKAQEEARPSANDTTPEAEEPAKVNLRQGVELMRHRLQELGISL